MIRLVREHAASETQVAKRPRVAGALFHYFCVAHRQRSAERSPFTIYDGRWAYCPNGYGTGHDWVAIEPTSDVDLLRFGPTFLRGPEPAPAPA